MKQLRGIALLSWGSVLGLASVAARSVRKGCGMHTRRSIAILLVLLTTLGVIVARPGQTVAQSKGPIEITLWSAVSGAVGPVIEELVKIYNASQGEIKVVLSPQGGYWEARQKLLAALVAGNPPDIIHLEVTFPPYFAATKVIIPLDEFARGKDGIDLTDIVPALLKDGMYEGKLYMLPFNRSTPLLYYNKDAFREVGLDPDKPPSTFEELREYARKLTKTEGNQVVRYGFGEHAQWWQFQAYIWSNGGEMSDPDYKVRFTEPAAVEAVQFFADLILKDQVAKFASGRGSTGMNNKSVDLLAGRTAMMVMSTSQLSHMEKSAKFALGTAFVPHGKKGFSVPTGGGGFSIITQSPRERQAAAWKFLKWMVGEKAQTEWATRTGYVPVTLSVQKSPTMQDMYKKNPNFRTVVRLLGYAHEWAIILSLPKTVDTFDDALERVLLGRQDAKTALAEAAAAITADAERFKKQLKK